MPVLLISVPMNSIVVLSCLAQLLKRLSAHLLVPLFSVSAVILESTGCVHIILPMHGNFICSGTIALLNWKSLFHNDEKFYHCSVFSNYLVNCMPAICLEVLVRTLLESHWGQISLAVPVGVSGPPCLVSEWLAGGLLVSEQI